MKHNSVVIMCPPLADYPEAPKDQSHSELFDCPKCKQKMWLSEKKKGALLFSACINKDIVLACYHCITKMVDKDPSIVMQSKKVDL
jgi:uncharacterized protein YbaR (Trm112 family)